MQAPLSIPKLNAKINTAIEIAAFKNMGLWEVEMTINEDGNVEVFGVGDYGEETFLVTDETFDLHNT